jgi:hypothetical protein
MAGSAALGVILLSAAFGGQEVKPAEFTKWEFARERIGHKVTADFTLVNPTGAEIRDAKLTLVYLDGDREVRRTKPTVLASLGEGKSTSLHVEAEQVQNFSRYEVILEYGGKARIYVGNDPLRPPVPKKAGPAKLALFTCTDTPPRSFPGEARVTVALRNTGESEAQECVVALTFLDKDSAVVKKARVYLGGPILSGSEDTFEIALPRLPLYASVTAAPACLASVGPSLGEASPDSKELEIATCRILRLTDGSVRLGGSIRNGLPKPVGKIAATFKLGGSSFPLALGGVLRSGETRSFELYAADCPPFEQCSYSLAFDEAQAGPAAEAAAADFVVRRAGSRALAAESAPGEKPKEKDPLEPKAGAKDDSKGIQTQLCGLLVIEGKSVRTGAVMKYSGDVFLLRLSFTDEKGSPCQPTPTINMVVYNGPDPYKKVQRVVTHESWKVDAAKVNAGTATDQTMAGDKKTGELWVAFLRTDQPGFDPRADITLSIRDQGTWTWKGMDKKFETARRGPDKK